MGYYLIILMNYIQTIPLSLKSLFEPKISLLYVIVLSISMGGIISVFETWVWDPYWTFLFLIGVRVFDIITAIDLSIYRGGSFETKKLKKTLIDCLFLMIFLGILHDLPLINQEYGIAEMDSTLKVFPKILYIYVLLNQIASAAKNAALANRISGKFSEYILKYIDKNKDILDTLTGDKK
tara:strand:+ start:693 stop:1232 length:540 start_codon:yes stop_codon:yes gene_type:complete